MKTDRICNMEDLSVYRLTQEAYDALRLEATDNPAIYLDPQTDFSKVLKSKGIESYVERTGIVCSESINLIPVSSGAPNRADHQALDFYKSLDGLNPSTASDGVCGHGLHTSDFTRIAWSDGGGEVAQNKSIYH